MKLVHWPLVGALLHLVQRGGYCARSQPPRPLLAVPNVTAHPSTASVPITVLLYNSTLLCSCNVNIKGLMTCCQTVQSSVQSCTMCCTVSTFILFVLVITSVFVCLSVCLSVSKITQKRVHGFGRTD